MPANVVTVSTKVDCLRLDPRENPGAGGANALVLEAVGEVGTRGQKWGSRIGYPIVIGALLVEAAAEPVLHPAGERPARTLGALLPRRALLQTRAVPSTGHARAR